jgi:hypothetical protein
MPPVGFERTISADDWPQAQVLDRAATVICHEDVYKPENKEAVVNARRLFRYRQLLTKIPAMLRGIFRIVVGILYFYVLKFHDFFAGPLKMFRGSLVGKRCVECSRQFFLLLWSGCPFITYLLRRIYSYKDLCHGVRNLS